MKTKRMVQIAAAGALSLLAQAAMAVCDPVTPGPGIQNVPLLGGNITVGRDVPVGSEIYRQNVTVNFNPPVSCTPGPSLIQTRHSLSAGGLPLSSWSGYPWGGSVYQTGVAGVGVVILNASSGAPLPNSDNGNYCSGPGACPFDLRNKFDVVLSFIKTGPLSSGQINGAQIPAVSHELVSDAAILYDQISFQGTMNVVSRTCTTPDVNVDMGIHKMNEFSGKGTYTPWQDFSIVLNDCPAFNGYFNGTGPTWTDNGTGGSGLNTRLSNVIQLRLDPTSTAIDPSLGILTLNPGAQGGPVAARGIGLQVGDSSGSPVPLAVMRPSGISTSSIEGASYSIPMKARYIQTEDGVGPGPANATAVFTINYQ